MAVAQNIELAAAADRVRGLRGLAETQQHSLYRTPLRRARHRLSAEWEDRTCSQGWSQNANIGNWNVDRDLGIRLGDGDRHLFLRQSVASKAQRLDVALGIHIHVQCRLGNS